MNCLPILGAALALVSASPGTQRARITPDERSLDAQLAILESGYFRAEVAIDAEIFLADEIDLIMEELLQRGSAKGLARGVRVLEARGGALRHAVVSERAHAHEMESELQGLLALLPDEALERERRSNFDQLADLRKRVDALEPGLSWSRRPPSSLPAEPDSVLDQGVVVLLERQALLREEIDYERALGHDAGAMAARAFVASAYHELLGTARDFEIERMAERGHRRGVEHLRDAAQAQGLQQEILLRAAERRLASVAQTYADWSGRPGTLDRLATARLALGRRRVAEDALASIVGDHGESRLAPRAAVEALALRFELGEYQAVLDGAREFAGVVEESDVAYYVGIAALALGDASTARVALERVDPSSIHGDRAQLSLAAAVAATGELDLARSMFADLSLDISQRGGPSEVRDRAVLSLGLLFFDAGRFGDTVEILKEIPSDSPVGTEAVLLAAQSLAGVGDVEAARRRLIDLHDAEPGTVSSLRALMACAELEVVAGRMKEAEGRLDEVVAEIAGDDRFDSLRDYDRQLAGLRREAALLERIEVELQQLQNAAQRAGRIELADQIGGLQPQLRSLGLHSRELVADTAEGASSEFPVLRKAAEMRLTEISLLRMENASSDLRRLTAGAAAYSTLVLAARESPAAPPTLEGEAR